MADKISTGNANFLSNEDYKKLNKNQKFAYMMSPTGSTNNSKLIHDKQFGMGESMNFGQQLKDSVAEMFYPVADTISAAMREAAMKKERRKPFETTSAQADTNQKEKVYRVKRGKASFGHPDWFAPNSTGR